MKNSELILGPPGCGKTHTLIEIVRQALDAGTAPESIGFFSFTKKAVLEAGERAGTAFNLTQKALPYFRTLHSLGYRELGLRNEDIMSNEDWRLFGEELGLQFSRMSTDPQDTGSLLPSGWMDGDRYLRLVERAKLRKVSLEHEFSEQGDYDLFWPELKKVEKLLETYRRDLGKYTFVDMLKQFVLRGNAPRLSMLIIDEAQDLCPLQWEMVAMLAERADKVYFAGDDDQAIHRWAGVDVGQFQTLSFNQSVLTQSHRLPESVFNMAQVLVRRVNDRIPKDYNPTKDRGTVGFHYDLGNLPLETGSWSLMARTNGYAKNWADRLRGDMFYYSLKGAPSVKQELAQSIGAWRELQKGTALPLAAVKALYKQLDPHPRGLQDPLEKGAEKLLKAADPQALYDAAELKDNYGLRMPLETSALDAISMSVEERYYIEAIERRGEDVTQPPRIKVSTIHAMKGGEDDNVGLYLGSTKRIRLSPHQDDEHRIFYVGATRAKQSLHFVEGKGRDQYVV